MNKSISIVVLIIADIIAIFISILLAVSLRKILNLFWDVPIIEYSYVTFSAVYVTLILILTYFGVYTKRFDFWHESKLIVRSCFLSFLMLFAGLALGQNADFYSRSTLILIFISCSVCLPISKLFLKRYLFKLGFWRKPIKVITDNEEFKNQLFEDHYLGYVRASGLERGVIFIDGQSLNKEKLNKIIENNINNSREIIFTPVLSSYDFSHSYIYNMFNSRTSIFTLENELLSKTNKIIKGILDYFVIFTSSIFWIPLLGIIAVAIKLEDKKGDIFFKQKRLGLNGKVFLCYKFRSMYSDQSFMEEWLKAHPDEKEYYDKYHKYINDPRVTKIGNILRKTSLDELPQLINVLKGEMSLVGPRPYMVTEKEDIGQKAYLVLSVKPGISGLWQVSGRSDVDFDSRVEIDIWYMKNWSLWNDMVILLKTIGTVLGRGGAR
ncbi:UDP-phosphate galactose phosphotransferase [Rodentibacter ratti]|uniref:sugar transferase n=1 Tax=Rodentibacter ratti TaxID=1906745 RepID=UPI0009870DB3|nr:sugar transferase [Rodentibacter ratti]OOF89327.1 UDP-phosphate galactose phosphotransferase [Rodentibacter ratti]